MANPTFSSILKCPAIGPVFRCSSLRDVSRRFLSLVYVCATHWGKIVPYGTAARFEHVERFTLVQNSLYSGLLKPVGQFTTKSLNMAYVRGAKPEEFDEFTDVALQAFMSDPVFNFFGSVKHMLDLDAESDAKACKNRRAMLAFLIKGYHLTGGRVTVAVEAKEDSKGERILAGCLWLPPRKRLGVRNVVTIARAGVIPVLRGWGLDGLIHVVLNYQGACEKKWREYFKAEKSHPKASANNSWYLQLACTSPKHQGRGLMSALIREAFSHSPDDLFTLEASTSKSRDQYLHLGFERPVSLQVAKGKSDARGLVASGTEAVGIEVWLLSKWPTQSGQAKNDIPVPSSQ